MKKMLRKIFRYKITTAYFILGQLILYITLFGGLGIYNQAFAKEQDRKDSMYQNRVSASISTADSFKTSFFQTIQENITEGNLVLVKNSVPIQEMGSSYRSEFILCTNEPLKYQLISGHLPGKNNEGTLQVALGRNKYKYSYEKNGKRYITVNNETYEVSGVLGSENSDYYDDKVVFHIDCIGEKVRSVLLSNNNLIVDITSDKLDLKNTYDTLYKNLITKYSNSVVVTGTKLNGTGDSMFDRVLAMENVKINYIVYLFCIVNCIIISEFWIAQRGKEIAIRKAYGMGNFSIFKLIISDVLVMSLFSLIAFMIILLVFQLFFAGSIGIKIKLDFFNAAVVAGSILMVSVATILIPMKKVLKLNASQGVMQ